MELGDSIKEAIAALPTSSPAAVAMFLDAKGVKGSVATISSCPIAQYVKGYCDITDGVRVYTGFVSVSIDRPKYDYAQIPLPLVVSDFIREFDAGLYTYLQW